MRILTYIFILYLVQLVCSSCNRISPRNKNKEILSDSILHIKNPFLPGYFAEPSIITYEGKYYVYATIDPWNASEIAVWESENFLHWTLRRINWPTSDQCPTSGDGMQLISAPSVVLAPDGKFYMYVTIGKEIWAGVSEHPLGPWYNLHPAKKAIIQYHPDQKLRYNHPHCFIDNDLQTYLYWNADYNWEIGRCKVVRLGKDMYSFESKIMDITPKEYFSAPCVFKKDNKYFLLYSSRRTNDSTNSICYAVSNSPLGNFESAEENALIQSQPLKGIIGPGHPTLYHDKDQHYVLYHTISTAKEYDLKRQMCIDSLIFTPDNSLFPISQKKSGFSINAPKTGSFKKFDVIEVSSSLSARYGKSSINDKHPGTFWISAKDDPRPYVVVDLGRVQKIINTHIWVEHVFGAYRYYIDYSKDLQQWQEFSDKTNSGSIKAPFIDSKSARARYLRITFYLPIENSRASIAELEIE